jgi:hypothetical protein
VPLISTEAALVRGNQFTGFAAVGRDYEPVRGQWYENVEEDETFRVLSVDEDSDLVEIEYLDGDIEELDIDSWHEMDLERIPEPEGWAAEHEADKKAADDDDDDEDEEDWDEDEDEDDDDWEDEEENGNY